MRKSGVWGMGGSEQPQFPMYMLLKLYIYIYVCFLNGTQILQSPLFIKKQKLGFL